MLEPGTHYVVKDGNIVGTRIADGTAANPNNSTIYVTVEADNLPLTRVLRIFPGGDIIADAVDPTLTELVNAGYADGKGTADNPAIPEDPTVTRPMKPFSSLGALGGVPATVPEGATAGANTAIEDFADPAKFITKPLGEASKLPIISSLPGLSSSTLTNQSVSTTAAQAGSPNKFVPVLPGAGNKNSSSGAAATGSNGLKNFTDRINDAVNKVTGGLTGAKPASDDNAS